MAGEVVRKPNALQKLFHRFFMQGPVTAFFAPWIHHLDNAILKLTRGKFAVAELAGWNVLQLTTIGAKSRQPRTLPLLGIFDDEKIAVIASSLGRKRTPGWFYNLKSQPECEVRFQGWSKKYIAHEATGEEYEHYWKLGLSYYAGYEKYKQRAAHRHIPIMVLEPGP